MANIENFKDELNYIHDNTIRNFTEYVLKTYLITLTKSVLHQAESIIQNIH